MYMKITFIQTGGTIDKNYPQAIGQYAFEITEPAYVSVLQRIDPNFEYEFIRLLKKDSMDLTDADRQLIYDTCEGVNNGRIIITHGTDTMTTTAKTLSTIKDKVIVLTGSMKPEIFSNSDAAFNVGVAVSAVELLSNGVYIAMNGRIYDWDKCKKDEKLVKFIEA